MAETILFSAPTPAPGQESIYQVVWYQSVDGETWGTYIDIAVLTTLPIDPASGKYVWTSSLVDPTLYHQIRTVDMIGVESTKGFILPPRQAPSTETSIFALKQDDGTDGVGFWTGVPVYDIGDTINLTLQVDLSDTITIGPTMPIEIKDMFGNIITTLTATLVNDIYVTSWTIPLSIHKSYNSVGVTDTSPNLALFYLKDSWVFPDGRLEFDFNVKRKVESPILNNSLYTISITGLVSEDDTPAEDIEIKFTSILNPYYATVHDVKSTLIEELSVLDEFDLVRDIILQSRQVDLHMRPQTIYRQEQFDLAVKMFIKYTVARQHLMFLLNINAESKEIDMLKYSRNSNDPKDIIDNLDSLINKYSLIILAGGKDTPFITKTFTKGIWDPNRTQANRLGLDTSDPYPWTNTTTSNSVVQINGNNVELRGTRTVSFLKNRSSFPNVYMRSEGPS